MARTMPHVVAEETENEADKLRSAQRYPSLYTFGLLCSRLPGARVDAKVLFQHKGRTEA